MLLDAQKSLCSIPLVVLITGGCGYIGSFLARQIPFSHGFEGEKVRFLDDMSGGEKSWSSLGTMPIDQKYELVIGDVRDKDTLDSALKDVETVFHLAAPSERYPFASASGPPPREMFEEMDRHVKDVIAGGTIRVLDRCIESDVDRFINTSSLGIFAPPIDETVVSKEETPCNPGTAYGQAKLEAERYCTKRAKNSGMHITSLRFGTASGYNIPIRMLNQLHRFVILACAGQPLLVWRAAVGKLRPFVDIRDVAQSFIFASTHPSCRGEVFNVTNYNAAADDLVKQVQLLIPDAKMKLVENSVFNQHDYNYPSDGSKLQSKGFVYKCTLADTISNLAEHYLPYYNARMSKMPHAKLA